MKTSNVGKPQSQIFPVFLSVFGSISALATTFILAKTLGSSKYGEIQYLLGLINTISYAITAGLPDFLAKNSQFSSDKKEFFSECFLVSFVASVLCIMVFIPIAYFLLTKIEKDWITIALLLVSGFSVSQVMICSYFFLGIGKKTFSPLFNDFLPRVSILVVLLVFLFLGMVSLFADNYLVIFSIIYSIIACFLLVFLVRKVHHFLSKKELLSIAIFFAIGLTSNINGQISKVFQGEMMDYQSTGALSLSAQIMAIASIFTSSITSLFRPELSMFYHNKDGERLFSLFGSLLRVISCFIVPFTIGVICQPSFLLSQMGDGYSDYPLILIFVGLSQGIELLFDPAHTLMAMTDHEKGELFVSIVNFSIFSLVCIFFGRINYWGIACGLLCGVLCKNAIRFFLIKKSFDTLPVDFRSLIFLVVESLISIAVFVLLNFLPNTWQKLIYDGLAGLFLVFLFFLLDPCKEDRNLFKKRSS
jgi:O-antigen/teichoic acid export membrane protein